MLVFFIFYARRSVSSASSLLTNIYTFSVHTSPFISYASKTKYDNRVLIRIVCVCFLSEKPHNSFRFISFVCIECWKMSHSNICYIKWYVCLHYAIFFIVCATRWIQLCDLKKIERRKASIKKLQHWIVFLWRQCFFSHKIYWRRTKNHIRFNLWTSSFRFIVAVMATDDLSTVLVQHSALGMNIQLNFQMIKRGHSTVLSPFFSVWWPDDALNGWESAIE